VQAGGGPEALEGLAQAAFFLDEPDLAIDAHERAYAAYRAAGREVDAAGWRLRWRGSTARIAASRR
jgi:hypothetical protein